MSSFERKTQVKKILTRLNNLLDYKAVQFGLPAIPDSIGDSDASAASSVGK